jgi:hypothetical protein
MSECKQITNLKKLMQQRGIENVPNASYISEALEKLIELEAENQALRETIVNAGKEFTEDYIVSKGVSFPDWEEGFNCCIDVAQTRMGKI